MPKLIIIRGNSGSGKTSVAKKLQKSIGRNTLLISQDMVRREMLFAKDGVDTPAITLITLLLQYGYENNEFAILEGILNSGWYKPLFEKAVSLYGENIFAYYYDLPFEETLKRHSTKKEKLSFGEIEMRRWWHEKDYISFIPEKILTADLSLEETVNLILSDVLNRV